MKLGFGVDTASAQLRLLSDKQGLLIGKGINVDGLLKIGYGPLHIGKPFRVTISLRHEHGRAHLRINLPPMLLIQGYQRGQRFRRQGGILMGETQRNHISVLDRPYLEGFLELRHGRIDQGRLHIFHHFFPHRLPVIPPQTLLDID